MITLEYRGFVAEVDIKYEFSVVKNQLGASAEEIALFGLGYYVGDTLEEIENHFHTEVDNLMRFHKSS